VEHQLKAFVGAHCAFQLVPLDDAVAVPTNE